MTNVLKKENRIVLIVAIFCLIFIGVIINYTYSFFAVEKTNSSIIAGEAESMKLDLTVVEKSSTNNGKLIPQLDEYITSAVIGRNGSCIDDNNNTVCQVYKITLKNSGSSSVYVNGEVVIDNKDNPNLKWAILNNTDSNVLTTPVLSGNIKTPEETVLTSNELFTAGQTKNYFIVVWISEIGLMQTDSGKFTGVVNFNNNEGTNSIQYEQIDNSGANAPSHIEGMIPVMYDESTSAWVKADTTSSTSQYGWYDYDAKKWANGVLVKESGYGVSISETNKTVDIDAVSTIYVSDQAGDYTFLSNDNKMNNIMQMYNNQLNYHNPSFVVYASYTTKSFEFITGNLGGTLSFNYIVKDIDGDEGDYLELYLDNTAIFYSNGSGYFSTELTANTNYTLELRHQYLGTQLAETVSTKNDNIIPSLLFSDLDNKFAIRASEGMVIISNLSITDLNGELTTSKVGGWQTGEGYSIMTFDSYEVTADGKYKLTGNSIYNINEAVGGYMCSDGISTECTQMYKIKTVDTDSITSVDVYEIEEANVRNEYLNAEAGTPINESDILAHYVWIPRYKYKVWNIDKEVGVDTYDAQNTGIDIVFIDENEEGTITCNYSYAAPSTVAGEPNETCTDITNGTGYYTHPAFKFGNDNVAGFWMGKFELSSTNQNVSEYGGGESIELTPRILPNVISWRNNSIDNFWRVIYDMQSTDNIYGLSTDRTNTDSHMLTNMEWGAVVYLTNSEYGNCNGTSCTEVAINNSQETSYLTNYTGRSSGSGTSTGYTETGTYIYKETNGQLASTTGNIYGVYDMSGGASEYIMMNVGTEAGQSLGSYDYSIGSAGNNYSYTGFEKYITTYAYGTTYNDQSAYNRGRLGDSISEVITTTGETGSWYNDSSSFPGLSHSWLERGGSVLFNNAGLFSFNVNGGSTSISTSTRAALIGF